ncbi:MAG: Grx4 family monothiol glutaredoxin [Nanoarchaeota archaeon]|nr:Grx4 family monothiol glutaredoxin [Nanoarchaeota archaeon]
MEDETKNKIYELLKENKIMLFMKGNRTEPMCGFSARVIQILNTLDTEYETFDVLEDPKIREGIKEYGNWPTIPQLYHKGELVGGCDIIIDLYRDGELKGELNSNGN